MFPLSPHFWGSGGGSSKQKLGNNWIRLMHEQSTGVNIPQSNASPKPEEKVTVFFPFHVLHFFLSKRTGLLLHVTSQETWNRHFQTPSLLPDCSHICSPLPNPLPRHFMILCLTPQTGQHCHFSPSKIHPWSEEHATQACLIVPHSQVVLFSWR